MTADFDGVLLLERIPLDSAGYDERGRYFGVGAPLYEYRSEDQSIQAELRAHGREDARDKLRRMYPKAKVGR